MEVCSGCKGPPAGRYVFISGGLALEYKIRGTRYWLGAGKCIFGLLGSLSLCGSCAGGGVCDRLGLLDT